MIQVATFIEVIGPPVFGIWAVMLYRRARAGRL